MTIPAVSKIEWDASHIENGKTELKGHFTIGDKKYVVKALYTQAYLDKQGFGENVSKAEEVLKKMAEELLPKLQETFQAYPKTRIQMTPNWSQPSQARIRVELDFNKKWHTLETLKKEWEIDKKAYDDKKKSAEENKSKEKKDDNDVENAEVEKSKTTYEKKKKLYDLLLELGPLFETAVTNANQAIKDHQENGPHASLSIAPE